MAVKKKRKKNKSMKRARTSLFTFILFFLIFVVLILLLMLFRRNGINSRSVPEASEPFSIATLPATPIDLDAISTNEYGWFSYEDEKYRSVNGVDVSSHQGGIDWESVRASGIEFAVIRLGYRGYTNGELNQDDLFNRNFEGAAAAGLDRGVYFFSQALNEAEAREEAQFVLSVLNQAPLDYPVYYDWEPVSSTNARTATITSSELTNCARAFCQVIESAGYQAGVYFNPNMAYGSFDLLQLQDYDFWLASYSSKLRYPYAVSMWQYACDAQCAGIETNVDINIRFIPK